MQYIFNKEAINQVDTHELCIFTYISLVHTGVCVYVYVCVYVRIKRTGLACVQWLHVDEVAQ